MARRNRVRRHRLHVLLPSEAGPVGRFLTSRAGVLLIALLALAAGFLLGRVTDSAADVRAEQQVRDIKAEYSRKLRNEREKAAVKAKEYVIIEEASAKLQVENQELLASMAALDDRVAFFKRMASPKAAGFVMCRDDNGNHGHVSSRSTTLGWHDQYSSKKSASSWRNC